MELLLALLGLVTALVGVWQQYVARQVAVSPSGAPQPAAQPNVLAAPRATTLPTSARKRLVVGTALRDAGVTFAVSIILGIFVGIAYSDSSFEEALPAIVGVNLVCLLVGFTISAVVAPDNRWKHVAAVAAAIWVLSFVNVVLGVGSVGSWLLGAIVVAFCAAVAGGLSYTIRKN